MSDDAEKIDFYVLLSVKRNATPEEILAAYRHWAILYHPDKIPEDDVELKKSAHEMLEKLNEAKETLLDETKRKIYDALGHDGLKQVTLTSELGDDLREHLEQARIERAIKQQSEIARPDSVLAVGINAMDLFKPTVSPRGAGLETFAPEVAYISAGASFAHRVRPNFNVLFHGRAGNVANQPPAIERRHGLFMHGAPRTSVGVELQHEKSATELRTLDVTTDGVDVFTTATVQAPLVSQADATLLSVSVSHSTQDGQFRATVAAVKPLIKTDDGKEVDGVVKLHVNPSRYEPVLEMGLSGDNGRRVGFHATVGLSPDALRPDAALAERMPSVFLTWKRHGAASVFVSLGTSFSFGYSIARHIDKYTTVRLSSRISTMEGFGWTVDYKRARQSISIPIQVTDDMPTPGWLVALFLAPVVLDLFTQHVLLRPYYARQREQKRKEILSDIAMAKNTQRLMKREANERRRSELDNRGIVILQARYGVHTDVAPDAASDALPTWLAVHIALQVRVHHERDYSRLVIVGDLSRLPGFLDLAPEHNKVLDVHYLYNGCYHHALIDDEEHVVLPSQEHRKPRVAWKDMHFDWPLDALDDGMAAAEGSAKTAPHVYNSGVD